MPILKLLTKTHDVSYNGLDDRVPLKQYFLLLLRQYIDTLSILWLDWEEKKLFKRDDFYFILFCLICRVETKGRVFEIKWVPSLFNSDNNKALLRGNNISPREAHGRNEFSKISLKESKKYWYCCMIIMKLMMIFARIIIIDYFNVSKLHVLWVWSDNL